MPNKKKISKLIQKKYTIPRKCILYFEFRIGWDFAVQFRDPLEELESIPQIHSDLPSLRNYVRKLETDLRNIPVNTEKFLQMADKLRNAREKLMKLKAERNEAFERLGKFSIIPENTLRIQHIKRHLL